MPVLESLEIYQEELAKKRDILVEYILAQGPEENEL